MGDKWLGHEQKLVPMEKNTCKPHTETAYHENGKPASRPELRSIAGQLRRHKQRNDPPPPSRGAANYLLTKQLDDSLKTRPDVTKTDIKTSWWGKNTWVQERMCRLYSLGDSAQFHGVTEFSSSRFSILTLGFIICTF